MVDHTARQRSDSGNGNVPPARGTSARPAPAVNIDIKSITAGRDPTPVDPKPPSAAPRLSSLLSKFGVQPSASAGAAGANDDAADDTDTISARSKVGSSLPLSRSSNTRTIDDTHITSVPTNVSIRLVFGWLVLFDSLSDSPRFSRRDCIVLSNEALAVVV